MPKKTRIDCRKCIHYHVTWEPANPHGCRALGFKSKYVPSLVVLRNSMAPCLYFQKKNPRSTSRNHRSE